MYVKKWLLSLLLLAQTVPMVAQQAWFVDGFHGGIYGHYPREWYTQFMCDELEKHPEWSFCLEIEPETWDTIAVTAPEQLAALRRWMTTDRVEYTNPAYAQPYMWNIGGESIIRQLTEGMRTVWRHFPEVTFTTYAVEEPCFTSCLPAVLDGLGFKYIVLRCPDTCWGGYPASHGKETTFMEGPDGTRLLAVPRPDCETLQPGSTWQTSSWANEPHYLEACRDAGIAHPVGMTYQDAGWKGGPWIGSGDSIRGQSRYTTWRHYFEKVADANPTDVWRFTQEDIRPNLMWGSQVMNEIATEVRAAENKLSMAEKMSAMALLNGELRMENRGSSESHKVCFNGRVVTEEKTRKRLNRGSCERHKTCFNGRVVTEENEVNGDLVSQGGSSAARNNSQLSILNSPLSEAWRTLMLAQHHDSWIVPYNNLTEKQTWAQSIKAWTDGSVSTADDIIQRSMKAMAEGDGMDDVVWVFNTTGEARHEVVRVPAPAANDNSQFSILNSPFYVVDVPPFGYACLSLTDTLAAGERVRCVRNNDEHTLRLENGLVALTFDLLHGGTIISLRYRGKEWVDDKAGYRFAELRGFFYGDGGYRSSSEEPVTCTVIQSSSPLIQSVRMEGTIDGAPFAQTFTLRSGSPRIDCELEIGWNADRGIGEYRQSARRWQEPRRAFCDDRYKLNILFPTAFDVPELWKNAPFDVCKSEQESTAFSAWDDIHHNIILHWVDVKDAQGSAALALFTDHTTSYSFAPDYPLALTAQYSGVGLWGRGYPITRPLHFRYALLPHEGTWDEADVEAESACWNEPLQVAVAPGTAGITRSLIDVEGTGYQLSCVRPTRDGVLLRLYNADGNDAQQTIRLGVQLTEVYETDLLERKTAVVPVEVRDGQTTFSVSMPRHALRTFIMKIKQ